MPKFDLPNSEFNITVSVETSKDIRALLNVIGANICYDFVHDKFLIWNGEMTLSAKLGDTIVYKDHVLSIESSGGDPCA